MLAALLLLVTCDKSTPAKATSRPSVASLVPAATDLIIGMGAGDHLAAVSNFDTRPEMRDLPRVGDYQDIDWERLASLRPDFLIVFMAPDRMPEGLRQHTDQLKIRLINMRMERLDDVLAEIRNLGDLLNEKEKASAAAANLRGRLEAVRQRVKGQPAVPTLIVRDIAGEATAGRGNFINDILEIAGGENVRKENGWPSTDRELLLSLKPQVVLVLLPDASPQAVGEAQRVWQSMSDVPAVVNRRVHLLTDWWMVQPGIHLADLAERFADLLHPQSPKTRPTSVHP